MRIDYDRAFARWKILRSVHMHAERIQRDHPDYRIVASTPFLVYPNMNLYTDPISEARLLAHWNLDYTTFRLDAELEQIARCALIGAIGEETGRFLNARSKTFFPWMTSVLRAADKTVVSYLGSHNLLH